MRFFRIPTFTGIEVHRDDADRGSLRVVEGCMPHGPGGLRSAPVWSDVGSITNVSDSESNVLSAANDGQGNSVLAVSKQGQIHDLALVTKEGTSITNFLPDYSVINPLGLYDYDKAIIAPVGNKLYSFGDGDGEAVFVGKANPDVVDNFVAADNELYKYEWSRFPNCKFFIQGPKKTLYASGNPEHPLRVYISEPATKTTPDRDSPYSTEDPTGNASGGQLSVVDILMSNATQITALSSRGDQIVVHTDKGCHILYAPTSDQASTGYRVEQVAATNFSAAVSNQVVSGETGSLSFWLGFDGQIYKDESASRGPEDAKSFTDPDQASWKSKGLWEKNFPTDLTDSFACYDRESGMYWVYVLSESYVHSIKDGKPGVVTRLKLVPDEPGVVSALDAVLEPPGVVSSITAVPQIPGSVQELEIITIPSTEGIEDFTALPFLPSTVLNLNAVVGVSGTVENLNALPEIPSVVDDLDAYKEPAGLVTDLNALPDAPALVEDLNVEILKVEGLVQELKVVPALPGVIQLLTANESPALVQDFKAQPAFPSLVENLDVTAPNDALLNLEYESFGTYALDPYLRSNGVSVSDYRHYHILEVQRKDIPNFVGYRAYKYTDKGYIPRTVSASDTSDRPTPQIEMLSYWPPEPSGTPASAYKLKPREVYPVIGLNSDRDTAIDNPIIRLPNGSTYTFNVNNGRNSVFRYLYLDGSGYSGNQVKQKVERDIHNCAYNNTYYWKGQFTNYGTFGSFLQLGCNVEQVGSVGLLDSISDQRVAIEDGTGLSADQALFYTEDSWQLYGSIKSKAGHKFAKSGSRGSPVYVQGVGMTYPSSTRKSHEFPDGIVGSGFDTIEWAHLEPGNGLGDEYSVVMNNGNIKDTVALRAPEMDTPDSEGGALVSFAIAMLYEVNGVVYETDVLDRYVVKEFPSNYQYTYSSANNPSDSDSGGSTIVTPPPVTVLPEKPGVVTSFDVETEQDQNAVDCDLVHERHSWRKVTYSNLQTRQNESYLGPYSKQNWGTGHPEYFPPSDALFITSLYRWGSGASVAPNPFTIFWGQHHMDANGGLLTPPKPITFDEWEKYIYAGEPGSFWNPPQYNDMPYGVYMNEVSQHPYIPFEGAHILRVQAGQGTGGVGLGSLYQMWVPLAPNGLVNGAPAYKISTYSPTDFANGRQGIRSFSWLIEANVNGVYSIRTVVDMAANPYNFFHYTKMSSSSNQYINEISKNQPDECNPTGIYIDNKSIDFMIIGTRPFEGYGWYTPYGGDNNFRDRGGAYHVNGTKFYLPYPPTSSGIPSI